MILSVTIYPVWVSDLERAIDFYTKLGLVAHPKLSPTDRTVFMQPIGEAGSLRIGSLSLIERDPANPQIGTSQIIIMANDVEAYYKALTAEGIEFVGVSVIRPNGIHLKIADPDGNSITVDIDYETFSKNSTVEQQYALILNMASKRSDREHQIRSTILDIHFDVETALKNVLRQILVGAMPHHKTDTEYQKNCGILDNMIAGLNFAGVHEMLRPMISAFDSPTVSATIQGINGVRKLATHSRNAAASLYKNVDPFADPFALYQLYLDKFEVITELERFTKKIVDEPRRIAEENAAFRQSYGEQKSKRRQRRKE